MVEFSKICFASELRLEKCDAHGEYESQSYKLGRNTHWIGCPACAQAVKTEAESCAAQVDAQARQQRLEARLNQSGIPLRYRNKTFASFIADTNEKEKVLAVTMEFANNFDDHLRKGTFLVLSGMPGTGKSHLGAAIAQQVMPRRSVLCISAIDAVRMIRDTWRRGTEQTETQVLNMLASLDLLVLDEVGVQHGTEAEQVQLFDIINKRYNDLKPTVLQTNLNKSGMKQFLGDRSFDRLREGGMWVTFDWPSQRASVAA
jgi:DNA replication protein DnaC